MYEARKTYSRDKPSPLTRSPHRLAELGGLCLRETRPVVQGIFLLRLLAGALLPGTALSYGLGWETAASVLVMAASWICVTSAIYIYNGVQDVEEDRENGSRRPIASRDLGVGQAMAGVGGLCAVGLLGSLLIHHDLVWALAAMLALGWLYSGPPLYLKRWPAGLALIVVVAAFLTYYMGYAVSGNETIGASFLIFAITMALWMGLVGQSKDLSDVVGDEKAGRKSLPVVWGGNGARFAVAGVACALGLGFLLSALFLAKGLLPAAAAVCLGACSVSILSLGPWGKGSRKRCRRPYKAFMITQYAAHAVIIFMAVGV